MASFWVVRVSGGEFAEDCKMGKYVASNCEILCLDCHKATRTYGG